ncbi:MAG: hypothetical protein ACOYH0_00255 [Saccharofermentanales bacterium]|jgi:hypothetical protein
MSIKLKHFIELFRVEQETDSDGFPVERDVFLASVRAYREDRRARIKTGEVKLTELLYHRVKKM